jgi:hypothetical protein
MSGTTDKTYRQITILMVDSLAPLSGQAKLKIWWNWYILQANKLQQCVRNNHFHESHQKILHYDLYVDPEAKQTLVLRFSMLMYLQ